ncbi:unnamed protein product [Rotaria magnacalcarata]|uniref:Uncharacterized protein n=1 Tax=Rotaria magnacalcarata TaxID=392030 RepID=A0A818ZE48_9BILA|nr:unnamed protein product [Rotaria magnacalcarata]CAF3762886.1 unnamed protein product [Rotaria magnacalcarata]
MAYKDKSTNPTSEAARYDQIHNKNSPFFTATIPFRRDYFVCTDCGAYSCGGIYSSVCDDCNGVASDPARNARHRYLCTNCARGVPIIAGVLVAHAAHILVRVHAVVSFANVYRLLVNLTNLAAIVPVGAVQAGTTKPDCQYGTLIVLSSNSHLDYSP